MKKILAMVAALSVIVSLVAGGTIAYLTDTESAQNTMTLGNVSIELKEEQFDENGKLVDYEDGKPLFPIVGEPTDTDNDGYLNHKQVVDKIVTIEAGENSSDAYVRTIIAYEYDEESFGKIVINDIENSNDVTVTEHGVVEINDVNYMVYVYTYNNPLTKDNRSTVPSLKQIYMASNATNDDTAAFGEKYDVLVLAQAVQTQGFASAEAAFTASFQNGGDLTDEQIKAWFGDGKTEPEETETPAPEQTTPPTKPTVDPDNLPDPIPSDIEVDGEKIDAVSNLDGKLEAPIVVDDDKNGPAGTFALDNCTLEVTGSNTAALSVVHPSVIILSNCSFTVPDGKYVVDNQTGGLTYDCYVYLYDNVSINGETVTSANMDSYEKYFHNCGLTF